MKISKIGLHNFRIYKGTNQIDFNSKSNKNISLIAGKNGFGKTTFLTSLIWCFYGKLMSQVEDKYKKDIKNIGGYDNYLISLINRSVLKNQSDDEFFVEIELEDLLIPSIPCRKVSIKRSYHFKSKEEKLQILIDGQENELTKDVGFEVFINDFILPREIAKFFFFDAEKIVTLAEAKTRAELKSLSKAYSEVLGIKKYEELKNNLESLLTNLRRRGVSKVEKSKLDELLSKDEELEKIIAHNIDCQEDIDKQLILLKHHSDSLQEKLIREGNSITLEELKELKATRDELREESKQLKQNIKGLLDLAPLVIAGKHLNRLHDQLLLENDTLNSSLNQQSLEKELKLFSNSILNNSDFLSLSPSVQQKIKGVVNLSYEKQLSDKGNSSKNSKILIEFSEERFREFQATFDNIKTTYLDQFNAIVKEEKSNRALLNRTLNKIKQAEARKDNHLAKKFREEKVNTDQKFEELSGEKHQLIEELGGHRTQLASHKKILSEYEKQFNLVETDKKKYEVTENLLVKINALILKIKQEKKYSLQKSVSLGLKKLMHKENFITNVRVNIVDDVMDIDLLDNHGTVIDKDSLSKGEQQLYATALLKALVDESGIKFPVFIDSPLQKFDKFHSKNIIKQFYPSISDQVVLFPLLEKELSETEYELLKPNLNKAFLIQNTNGVSTIKPSSVNKLFAEFKKEDYVSEY